MCSIMPSNGYNCLICQTMLGWNPTNPCTTHEHHEHALHYLHRCEMLRADALRQPATFMVRMQLSAAAPVGGWSLTGSGWLSNHESAPSRHVVSPIELDTQQDHG